MRDWGKSGDWGIGVMRRWGARRSWVDVL
jgi:hypothetical protein